MAGLRDGSMRRDILSAYAASGSRVASWVIVSAIIFRHSTEQFAMLALIRGTIGILNYASLGLLPAMIRAFSNGPSLETAPVAVADATSEQRTIQLSYITPQTRDEQWVREQSSADTHTQRTYATGMMIALLNALIGAAIAVSCAVFVRRIYDLPPLIDISDARILILALGCGSILRWCSDPAGALLQTRGRIFADNIVLITTEVLWIGLSLVFLLVYTRRAHVDNFIGSNEFLFPISSAFFLSSFVMFVARTLMVRKITGVAAWEGVNWRLIGPLLATGALITLAQLADYLYSPTDYLLINHLLSPLDLASYAPAMQIDSGLLLLVTGLGSVLLPKTAMAHAAGNREVVRTYYLRGTLASAALLLAASAVIYLASPVIFSIWFGEQMPGTVAILPLVLLNTIIGGSSAVGRAILIGVGKAKPFTISVLIAGVSNVVCSFCFVRYCGWGLKGIIAGTIVAVVVRCGIWMPWYVLRELKRDSNLSANL